MVKQTAAAIPPAFGSQDDDLAFPSLEKSLGEVQLPDGEMGPPPGFSQVALGGGVGKKVANDFLVTECASIKQRMGKASGDLLDVLKLSFDATGCQSLSGVTLR
eukprot:TRINITY_DN55473_c0_g1_i1.p2 TRINITY_DN55473_c0_g1~~TRINITY_DN55473_c0_g1_i1.p2  ORF type:complete len:104 (+),score=24.83 TRINITY_DN55473_c0_g1_i1:149-460(+)